MRRAVSIVVVLALGVLGATAAGLPASAHIGHTIKVTDDAVNEGGTATVTVTVTPATQNTGGFTGKKETITVGVSTIDGTAVAPGDYTTKALTLTFSPGQSTKTFTVVTAQDAVAEGNETLSVRLSNPTFSCVTLFGNCPTSGTITDDTGVVTIVDDEAPPPVPGNLLISDSPTATVLTDCVHTVTLAPATTVAVTVDFTATGSVNQLSNTTGSISFAPGETTKTVTLDVIKQKKLKGLVTVTLSNAVGANIVDGTGTCAIKKKKKKK